uniref:Uncharacterized protein n=1 Tax=Arundo donax TaxID=35708 RepID=A0A0A9F041_ARUDO
MISEQIAWQSFPPYMVHSLINGSSACEKMAGTNSLTRTGYTRPAPAC